LLLQQISIDSWCAATADARARQQISRTPLLLSIDGTDRQTDRRTDGRTPTVTKTLLRTGCAGIVNKVLCCVQRTEVG